MVADRRGPPPQGWHVSPNGEMLATFNVPSRKDGKTVYSPVIVQEIATGKILVKIEGETFLRFSPDSKTSGHRGRATQTLRPLHR